MPYHLLSNNAFNNYAARRVVGNSSRIVRASPVSITALVQIAASPPSFGFGFGASDFDFPHRRRKCTTSTAVQSRHDDYHHGRFPEGHHQPYKRAVANIISNGEFKSMKASLIGQGLWSEGMFQLFERWLLQTKPAIDERATREHWRGLSGRWMAGFSAGDEPGTGGTGPRPSSRIASDLASQREALRSVVFAAARPPDPAGRDAGDASRLVSSSFSRVATHVFHELLDLCVLEGSSAARSRSSLLPVAWYKAKEGGVSLGRSRVKALLAASASSRDDRPGPAGEAGGRSRPAGRRDALLEELVIYHDLLSEGEGGAEEGAFYRRYPSMLAYHCKTGDAGAALSLLRRVRTLPRSPFKYDHYIDCIAMLAENGHFR